MKNKVMILSYLLLIFAALIPGVKAYAIEKDTEFITITVKAEDNNEELLYAIDEPVNFSTSNTFTIPTGTSHTIYVKDAAGNITSQQYIAETSGNRTVVSSNRGEADTVAENKKQEINIDLELGMNTAGIDTQSIVEQYNGDYKNYEYLTDTAVEKPQTTVQSKTTTDGTDTAEKVFYSIVTAEGETFHLVIDQGSSNAVYLLNAVTLDDLKAIAASNTETIAEEKKQDNLLEALKASDTENAEAISSRGETTKKSSSNNYILLLLFTGGAAGVYYYFKIYRKKKNDAMDVMDARDMEEFRVEEDDDEELEFDEFDDEKKQQLLDELISGDEDPNEQELLNQNPEEYIEESNNECESEMAEEANSTEKDYQRDIQDPEQDEEVSRALAEAGEYDEELDGEE